MHSPDPMHTYCYGSEKGWLWTARTEPVKDNVFNILHKFNFVNVILYKCVCKLSRTCTHTWFQLREYNQVHLAAPMFSVNVARHGKTWVQNLLSIVYGCLQKVLKVLILRHVLVSCFTPLSHSLQTQDFMFETYVRYNTGSSFKKCIVAAAGTIWLFLSSSANETRTIK